MMQHSPTLLGFTPQLVLLRFETLQARRAPPLRSQFCEGRAHVSALLSAVFHCLRRRPRGHAPCGPIRSQNLFLREDCVRLVHYDSGVLCYSSRLLAVKYLLLRGALTACGQRPEANTALCWSGGPQHKCE